MSPITVTIDRPKLTSIQARSLTARIMSLLPTNNNATGHEPLTAFKLSDKIISITLFLLTPLFMVIMFAFCCIALAARGLPFGLVALISWEYAFHTTPSDAPSFWRTLLGTQQTVIIGGCMIGFLIGIILSITYISERSLPMGVRRLGPQRRLPYISSDVKKGAPWPSEAPPIHILGCQEGCSLALSR